MVNVSVRTYEVNQHWSVCQLLLERLGEFATLPTASKSDIECALQTLRDALRGNRWKVHHTTQSALVRMGAILGLQALAARHPSAGTEILWAIENDPHVFVRRPAANALAKLMTSNSDFAAFAVQSSNKFVDRLTAILEMEMADLPSANTTILRQSCSVLERLAASASDAQPLLRRLASQGPDDVRASARRALTQIRGSSKVHATAHPKRPINVRLRRHGRPPQTEDGTMPTETREPTVGSPARPHSRSSSHDYSRLLQKTRENAGELRALRREVTKIHRQLQSVLDHLRIAEEASSTTADPGEMIKKIQNRRHRTLKEIGQKIGLSESQMSRIARGQCEMKAAAQSLLQKMADEVGS
jgi:hypothetical protein